VFVLKFLFKKKVDIDDLELLILELLLFGGLSEHLDVAGLYQPK
jgi:hypothetical protein